MYIDSKLVDYLCCITSSVYQLCNVGIIHFFCPKLNRIGYEVYHV